MNSCSRPLVQIFIQEFNDDHLTTLPSTFFQSHLLTTIDDKLSCQAPVSWTHGSIGIDLLKQAQSSQSLRGIGQQSRLPLSPQKRLATMGFISWLITHLAPVFLATSPVTSYADQIYSIHRSRSSTGFSLDIPLIMLVASILK